MDKERGFLEYARKDAEYRSKDERLQDYRAVELRPSDRDIYEQAARCMDCGIPFCHGCGCPLENIIPEFNELVFRHRWEDALDLLLATSCFPEFTGRICPAPCETACVLGINDDPVAIREVELAIIEKGFERGYITASPPAVRRAESVAVVGSGPAGLSVADVLNRAGINVTVYENAAHAGGILRYGIPDFKMEKWVVERRVKLMEAEGVVFETGVEAGEDVSPRFLQSRFDAIVLTGGAMEPRDLRVPGRDLDGIHFAMDFLGQQNRRISGEDVDASEAVSAEGKCAVVIGGGDTGSDCLGTVLRQGAARAYQFEIMPKPPPVRSPSTPWPMWPDMLRESSSHKEGGERRWCVTTKAFRGEGGRLQELVCAEVEWVPSEDGARPSPHEIEGSEFVVDADLVLLAMGFVGPGRNRLVERLEIDLDERGFIRQSGNHQTSMPGVFVAGDMTRGASLVVRAMADGQAAARDLLDYLGANA